MAIIIGQVDPPGRELRLDTAAGRQIDNWQGREITGWDRAEIADYTRIYGHQVEERGKPTATYNCHGLTFANRRTCLSDDVISGILTDDDYKEVPGDRVKPGDVILFKDATGAIKHSGVVLVPPTEAPMGIARIWSKWGKYSEVVHFATVGPYGEALNFSYYRIRRDV